MRNLSLFGLAILCLTWSSIETCKLHTHKDISFAQAVLRIEDLIGEANKIGTYGISGMLVDKNGKVYHQQRNRVIDRLGDENSQRFLLNPTNHVERQTVSWYWKNKKQLKLPEPSQLTVLTSLDPCIMCAASLVASGFNVGTFSPDDFAGADAGGANPNDQTYTQFKNFTFAPKFKQSLLDTFGYYRVINHTTNQIVSDYKYKAEHVAFKDFNISIQTRERILKGFSTTAQNVRDSVGQGSLPLGKLLNLQDLPKKSPLKDALKQLYPEALSIELQQNVKVNGVATNYFQPDEDLKKLLTNLVRNTPGANNALALIDPYGNLLIARADRFDQSPISSAILKVVTDYSEFHFKTIQEEVKETGKSYNKTIAYQYLPAFKDCTYIFLNALPGDEAISIQTIGIYGSSVEGYVPKGGFLYINDYPSPNTLKLQSIIQYMPYLYQSVIQISPMQATLAQSKDNQENIQENLEEI